MKLSSCVTWRCLCFSVVPEATYEASQGPLKGAMSAQKALQRVPDGDEGGGGKNAREVFTPMMGYCFKQTNDLFFKKDTEKLT